MQEARAVVGEIFYWGWDGDRQAFGYPGTLPPASGRKADAAELRLLSRKCLLLSQRPEEGSCDTPKPAGAYTNHAVGPIKIPPVAILASCFTQKLNTGISYF